jgi:hypothetical protein
MIPKIKFILAEIKVELRDHLNKRGVTENPKE